MSRTIFGTKKIVKIDKHTRSKYTESDIHWEQFKIFIWILLGVLYIYFIVQPQHLFGVKISLLFMSTIKILMN